MLGIVGSMSLFATIGYDSQFWAKTSYSTTVFSDFCSPQAMLKDTLGVYDKIMSRHAANSTTMIMLEANGLVMSEEQTEMG